MNDKEASLLFKAISEEKRLKILDMLSSGSLCACEILKYFNFTQSALSQHMKILIKCGLVIGVREGNWMHYSLDKEKVAGMSGFLNRLAENEDKVKHGLKECCK